MNFSAWLYSIEQSPSRLSNSSPKPHVEGSPSADPLRKHIQSALFQPEAMKSIHQNERAPPTRGGSLIAFRDKSLSSFSTLWLLSTKTRFQQNAIPSRNIVQNSNYNNDPFRDIAKRTFVYLYLSHTYLSF